MSSSGSPEMFTTLPPELLSDIFLFLLPASPGEHRELVRTVVRISAVCSAWRQVAIGTASLWTTINVGCDFSLNETPDDARERVTAFIEKSKTAPLYLSIGFVRDKNTWLTCWTIVVPHLERCRFLLIELPKEVDVVPLWRVLGEQHFQSLEYFVLLDPYQPLSPSSSVSGHPNLLGRGQLPALKTLIHVTPRRAPPATPIAPSLDTLILIAPRLTLRRALTFLANFPTLITVTVKHVRCRAADMLEHIILPELRTLVTDKPTLLANVSTPVLETLGLEDVKRSGWGSALAPSGSEILSNLAGLKSLRFTRCKFGDMRAVSAIIDAANDSIF